MVIKRLYAYGAAALAVLFLGSAGTIRALSAAELDDAVRAKALAHYIMAVSHELNSRPQEAIKEYERTVDLDRDETLPRLRLASYYMRSGEIDRLNTAHIEDDVAAALQIVSEFRK